MGCSSSNCIESIVLWNEKYKGDALLQKTFCVDFPTKKFKVNDGEIPQYYVEHNHEAIIDPDTFDMAQRELSRRCAGRNRHSGVHAFSGKIKCGQCGSWYGSKVWHSTDKYRRVIWQCNQKFKGGEKCTTPHLDEESIKGHFIRAVNVLLQGREEAIFAFEAARDTVFNVDALLAKQTDLESEMAVVSEMMQTCIRENATFAQDQAEFQRWFDSLSQRFEETKARYDAVTAEISDKRLRQATMEDFLMVLREQDGEITKFDTMLWSSLVDFATVYGAEDIRFTFKNGQEIQG